MSIAELGASHYQDSGPESFDRTPPQDVVAEQSVLGGMMLSKDAIADVVEVLRGYDFYRPAHEIIFDAVISLYGRGEPADAVTVSDELTKRGDLGRVGGAPYLHTLISSVPTAANAGYYARIVRERAVLRRLVEAGTKIVQLGYATTGGDVDDLVNAAQAEVYAVTERGTSEDYLPIGQIIESTVDEIEAAGQHGDGMVGVPTGFADLDRLTNGLHPGQMIVLAARPAIGKALALDTPLPTPEGWTTMGEVRPGDLVLGADGRPARVLRATEVMANRPCYQVHFSDGSMIVADGQHQWLTETRASRKSAQAARAGYNRYRNQRTFAEVRTTEQIAATVRCPTKDRRLNHSITNAQPLDLPPRTFLIEPYTLGAWLGDGTSAAAMITTNDPDIVMRLEADGYDAVSMESSLRTIGVLAGLHIPSEYLRGSISQRRDLLAGLLDTDGTVAPTGLVQFTSTSRRLADDVRELVVSLGHRCSVSSRHVHGRTAASSTAYTVSFSTDDDVFWLPRKQKLHKERRERQFTRRGSRFITDVVAVPSVPVRCIEVDNADHLYLAGASMIPTHNSTLGLDIARSAAIKNGLTSVIFSLEMSRTEITMRMLSAEARIPLQKLRQGRLEDTDWTKMARTMGELTDAPLFIDDSPNMSLMEIRAKCRRLKQRNDLKLVVIDYLQLMSSGKRVESRQQEVSEFSRAIKLLAKELEVPVIAISQLNRGSEQRTDKKPQMSDLRESGCLTRDTRVLRADTGAETTMGELYDTGATDVPVWSLDDSLRYVRRHLTHVFSTGVKPVFTLRLASGKQVRATGNHPFLTYGGWTPLEQLGVGARVAVPRHVPAPKREASWTDEQVVACARRLGAPLAGSTPIPDDVFHLPKRQIALLVHELWREGGEFRGPSGDDPGTVAWAGAPSVATALTRLLLRFGISANAFPGAYATGLELADADDRRRFLQEIGVERAWTGTADALLDRAVADARRTPERLSQHAVWRDVERTLGRSGPATDGSRSAALSSVASLLDEADLDVYAINDLVWDTVVSITPDGDEEVFDATVLGNHNFIANGIAVHNSIEQDADMVILLHREDAYEKESPRAGEADFIVAKHRNGPTDTITVAFQGHYSRFVDMAQS